MLNKIIRPYESAFIDGRSNANIYIIAHEVIHYFKSKRKEKNMGLNLDMAKAYDCMEWDFLSILLEAFGSNDEFIKIILECILSILLNGSPFGLANPSRGLIQRDFLSIYLFNLGVEVLSQMLLRPLRGTEKEYPQS